MTDTPSPSPPRRDTTRARRIALGVFALSSMLAIVLWISPRWIDAARFGSLDTRCKGVVTLDGEVAGEAIGGRHCRVGMGLSGSPWGYLGDFEYGRDGHVFFWGRGPHTAAAGDRSAIDVAMLRTPGDDGTWYCATGGTWASDAESGSRHTLTLTGLHAIAREQTLRGDGTLTVGDDDVRLAADGQTSTFTRNGHSIGSDGTRVDIRAGEAGPGARVHIRADDRAKVDHAFALVRRGHPVKAVELTIAQAGGEIRFGDEIRAELAGMTRSVSCPAEGGGDDSMTLSWRVD